MSGATAKGSSIEFSQHVHGHLFGMTLNLDTIWATVVAGLIVIGLGLWARAKLTRNPDDQVPSKVQLIWEAVVNEVNTQVEANLGRLHPVAVPLAVSLFLVILIANWLEIIPSEPDGVHLLPAPTADTNFTFAMAITTMITVWIYGIRSQGLRAYLKHFTQPYLIMTPLNILEELVKPFTLALRLFGNIFAGSLMISIIGSLPVFFVVPANAIWKAFDTMFLGAIQAFIFGLLTIIYFGMAGGHGQHEEEEEHATSAQVSKDEYEDVPRKEPQVVGQPS